MARKAKIYRKTTETEVSIELNLDGAGERKDIDNCRVYGSHAKPFARHGLIHLIIKGHGDTQVDDHHLVEDIGICLGDAVKKAVGDKKAIRRYGSAITPMDESLCSVAMDISGRPYLIYNVEFKGKKGDKFDYSLLREFFKSFSDHSGITLHINLLYGRNNHHIAEAFLKPLPLP